MLASGFFVSVLALRVVLSLAVLFLAVALNSAGRRLFVVLRVVLVLVGVLLLVVRVELLAFLAPRVTRIAPDVA